MFKVVVVSETLAWWPVLFAGVAEDGEVVENKIELRFRILDEDEIDDFARSSGILLSKAADAQSDAEGVGDEVARMKNSVRMQTALEPIVRGWRLVAGENGESLPFTDSNFQALLRVPNVFPAILRAYGACRAGRADMRVGN